MDQRRRLKPGICFILNPRAGNQREKVEACIRDVFGNADYEIVHTAYAGHGTHLAREAADRRVGLVVAVGGDGTLNEVGRGVLGTETALGLVPYGSGNGFARALGLPLNLMRACEGLRQPEVRSLDVGRIAETVFFSNAGVGLDALVCHRYNNRPGKRRGFLPYVFLTAASFFSYRPVPVEVVMDGGVRIQSRPVVLTVANTAQYGNGAVIAPGALADDGLLNLCVIEETGLLRGMGGVYHLFNGTIDRFAGVRLHQIRSLQIVRPESGPMQVDGEAMEGPAVLDVEVIPGGIQMALQAQDFLSA